MRLLHTSEYHLRPLASIEDEHFSSTPRYAILSHRWIEPSVGEEITFSTFDAALLRDAGGSGVEPKQADSLAKIKGACRIAANQGIRWLWLDTVCIDKSSSTELGTALNSMFEWYNQAEVCFTYLPDVAWSANAIPGPNMFKRRIEPELDSEWFERGWTLQELLAPRHMVFYDKDWRVMGTRKELASYIEKLTRINAKYLNGEARFQDASVAAKMSWMAGRTTKKVEDIAYSLLGIFSVEMTPQYGEGTKAFFRLQDTIMLASSFDESIFAWHIPSTGELECYRKVKRQHGKVVATIKCEWSPPDRCWGLLAPSPDCFNKSGNVVVLPQKVTPRLRGGFRRTHQGLNLALPLRDTKNAFGVDKKGISLPLNCWRSTDSRNVVLQLSRVWRMDEIWKREQCDRLDFKDAKIGNNRVLGFDQQLTSSLTVQQPLPPPESR